MDINVKEFVYDIIDRAIEKGDRSVSLYFSPQGLSVSVYPLEYDAEEMLGEFEVPYE